LSALALLIALVATTAHGASMRRPIVRAEQPIAPLGGVMMLPLDAQRHGDHWPSTINIELDDGRRLDGHVLWITPRQPAPHRRWTEDPRFVAVRFIEFDDDSSSGTGMPFLAVELPSEATGTITILGRTLRPIWRDPTASYAGASIPGDDRPQLEHVASPARPDPASPFEHWRWVLLADRLTRRPPPVGDHDEAAALVARHFADLWRIGLARLSERSPGIAAACRDRLTRICHDGDREMAGWVANPDSLRNLLDLLLDFDRPLESVARDALSWADGLESVLFWPVSHDDTSVTIAGLNRSLDEIVARVHFSESGDVPVAVMLPAGQLTRVRIDRPAEDAPRQGVAIGGPSPEPRELVVDLRGRTHRFTVGPRLVAAQPPGVMLGWLQPPITLADVEGRGRRGLPAAAATTAQLRRRADRWELFFECSRRAPSTDLLATSHEEAAQLPTTWDAMRGHEAVSLLVGPADEPDVVLTVPEHGEHRLLSGADHGALQVHRRSYADRWYCRIVLPDEWITPEGSDAPRQIRFGCARTHGDSMAMETAPFTGVPWRQQPGRVHVRLDRWTRLP
jgi:hypothetical protein